jgi:hypothetical protein
VTHAAWVAIKKIGGRGERIGPLSVWKQRIGRWNCVTTKAWNAMSVGRTLDLWRIGNVQVKWEKSSNNTR